MRTKDYEAKFLNTQLGSPDPLCSVGSGAITINPENKLL